MPRFVMHLSADPARWGFGQRLYWHLFVFGTWPDIDPDAASGRPWLLNQITPVLGRSEKTIKNWCQEKALPDELGPIAAEIFGNNPRWAGERRHLSELLAQARARKAQERAAKRGVFTAAEDGTPSIAGEVIRACLPVLWRDPRADGSGRSAPHDGRHGAMSSRRFALTDRRERSIDGEILPPDAAISGGRSAGGSARRLERREPLWRMPRGIPSAAWLVLLLVAVGLAEWRSRPAAPGVPERKTSESGGTAPRERTETRRADTGGSGSGTIAPQPGAPDRVADSRPPRGEPAGGTRVEPAPIVVAEPGQKPTPANPPAGPSQVPAPAEPGVGGTDHSRGAAAAAERRRVEEARVAALMDEAKASRDEAERERTAKTQRMAEMGFRTVAQTRLAGISIGVTAADTLFDCALACFRDGCDGFAYQTGEPPAGEPASKACYRYKAPLTRMPSSAYTSGERLELRRETSRAAPELPRLRFAQAQTRTGTDAGSGPTCVAGIGTMNMPGFEILCDMLASGGTALGSQQLAFELATVQACAARCRAVGRCVAFTYDGREPGDRHRCEIFGPTPGVREVAGFITGRR